MLKIREKVTASFFFPFSSEQLWLSRSAIGVKKNGYVRLIDTVLAVNLIRLGIFSEGYEMKGIFQILKDTPFGRVKFSFVRKLKD